MRDRARRTRSFTARALVVLTAALMLFTVACGGKEDGQGGGNAPPVENRWDAMSWDQGEWASRTTQGATLA